MAHLSFINWPRPEVSAKEPKRRLSRVQRIAQSDVNERRLSSSEACGSPVDEMSLTKDDGTTEDKKPNDQHDADPHGSHAARVDRHTRRGAHL